jgi:hypothetical protein
LIALIAVLAGVTVVLPLGFVGLLTVALLFGVAGASMRLAGAVTLVADLLEAVFGVVVVAISSLSLDVAALLLVVLEAETTGAAPALLGVLLLEVDDFPLDGLVDRDGTESVVLLVCVTNILVVADVAVSVLVGGWAVLAGLAVCDLTDM